MSDYHEGPPSAARQGEAPDWRKKFHELAQILDVNITRYNGFLVGMAGVVENGADPTLVASMLRTYGCGCGIKAMGKKICLYNPLAGHRMLYDLETGEWVEGSNCGTRNT